MPTMAATYEAYLEPMRDRVERVLEIGVEHGGSLHMWAEFFPRARIWGIDIKKAAKQYAGERVTVRIGSQSDEHFLRQVVKETGPLDLVLDDGSHQFDDQRDSLLLLWPYIKPGGLYIVEDVHTSYRERKYGGALGRSNTFMETLKEILDDVHVKTHKGPVTLQGLASVHVHFQTVILPKWSDPRMAGPIAGT